MFLNPRDSFEIGQVSNHELHGLLKALEAGHGTDSATMTGGRSLIPQDIETTLVMALRQKEQDFKLMNILPRPKVNSTVHEYTRMNDVGVEKNVFVAEGGSTEENTGDYERVTKPIKYMQSFRKVTLQMRVATTLEDAEANEKMLGTLEILRGAEAANFHGNSSVVPVEYDGVIKQIKDGRYKNILDLRGQSINSVSGEDAFNKLAASIYEAGGYATHAFMPVIIAEEMQNLVRDRLRFNVNDRLGSLVVERYPTPFSDSIVIAGKEGGPDKMFRVKGRIVPQGGSERPNAPTIALQAQAKTGGTGFDSSTAGTYYYQVFAVSEKGISNGASASVAVAAGQEVKITITPAASNPGTGFIVCRSKKGAADASDCREMFRVPREASGNTIALDQNDDLPGTGEIVMLSIDSVQPSIQWDQFLPLMRFDLYPTNSPVIPFLVILFGALDVKVPWYHGLIKNVGYRGLDWFAS